MSIATLLTMSDETIHFKHGADCFTVKATETKMAALKKEFTAKDHGFKSGACDDPSVACRTTHGYQVCASSTGVEIPDILELETITAWTKDGHCWSATGSTKDVNDAKMWPVTIDAKTMEHG